MRNRYLGDADSGRATFDITGPLTSIEQNSVLKSGRFSTDIDGSPGDGDSSFKNVRFAERHISLRCNID
ncbi:conjugal transfer mating pair stabilization protein TraG [Sphingobium faniae]|nr:conjugal transfer mating pair stabilization protein TraG [Sphingobium faniae]